MIDAIRLLARYNAHANAEMNKVLSTLTPEEWETDRGGYFPSFRSLTGHLYTADVVWMVRFTGLRPLATVKGSPFDFPPSFGELPFGSFGEYENLRTLIDQKLIALTEEITAEDCVAELGYRNSRGEAHTKNVGGLLVHLFNHSTHHRGQISVLLDQMKKPNDYSNVLSIL